MKELEEAILFLIMQHVKIEGQDSCATSIQ